MKHTMKKWIAVILTLIMVLNMLPVSGLSDGTAVIPEPSRKNLRMPLMMNSEERITIVISSEVGISDTLQYGNEKYYLAVVNDSGEIVGQMPLKDDASLNTSNDMIKTNKLFIVMTADSGASNSHVANGPIAGRSIQLNTTAQTLGGYRFYYTDSTDATPTRTLHVSVAPSATFVYKNADGGESAASHVYAIQVKDQDNHTYYAIVPTNGGSLVFKNDAGVSAAINNISGINDVRKIRDGVDLSSINVWNNDVTNNADTVQKQDNYHYFLDEHILKYSKNPATQKYEFVAQKPGSVSVVVELYEDEEEKTSTPYTASILGGEVTAVAQITGTVSGTEKTWVTSSVLPVESEPGKTTFGNNAFENNNNGEPTKAYYFKGDNIAVYAGVGVSADNGNGTVNNVVNDLDGKTVKGYSFTKTYDETTNTYTYTGIKVPPYQVTLEARNATDSGTDTSVSSIDSDSSFWYVLAKLQKSYDASTYYYAAKKVNLENGAQSISVDSFAERNNTNSTEMYASGDKVKVYLVKTSSQIVDSSSILSEVLSSLNVVADGGALSVGTKTYLLSEESTAGSTALKLKIPPVAKTTVSYFESDEITAATKPASLLPRTDGKYYVVLEMATGNTNDPTAYFLAELNKANGQEVSTSIFTSKNNQANYLSDGRKYTATLIFVPSSCGLADADAVKTQLLDEHSQQKGSFEYYSTESVVEGAKLTAGSGKSSNPNSTIKLTALPKLTLSGTIPEGAFADTDTPYYYVLAKLEKDGKTGYAYQLFINNQSNNLTEAKAFSDNFLTEDNARPYLFFAEGDSVEYSIVKSATALTAEGGQSVLSQLKNLTQYADGQFMGEYTSVFTTSGYESTVTLTQKTVNPQEHTIRVQLKDYKKVDITEPSEDQKVPDKKYYMLAYLTPRGTESKGQVQAWTILPVDLGSASTSDSGEVTKTPGLNTTGSWTATISTNTFNLCDANHNSIGVTTGYDPELFDINFRIYHGSSELDTSKSDAYRTLRGEDVPSGQEAPYKDNAPDNYDYMDAVRDGTGTVTTVPLHQAYGKQYELHIKIEGGEGLTISADQKYYLIVDVEHKSGGNSFAALPLILSNQPGELTIKDSATEGLAFLKNGNSGIWFNGNGTADNNITGNEKAVSVYIVSRKTNNGVFEIENFASQRGEYTHLYPGESINFYTFSSENKFKKTDSINAENPSLSINTIYNEITFTADTSSLTKSHIDSVLRTALDFGVFTNNWSKHTDDMESNIAAKEVTATSVVDFGFSGRNLNINRLTVHKTYYESGSPANNKEVKLRLVRITTRDCFLIHNHA